MRGALSIYLLSMIGPVVGFVVLLFFARHSEASSGESFDGDEETLTKPKLTIVPKAA